MSKRIVWAVIAAVVVLLMVAPLASYCLGREQDFREKGELRAPVHSGLLETSNKHDVVGLRSPSC